MAAMHRVPPGDYAGTSPHWLRQPDDVNVLVPALWSSSATKHDGVLHVGGMSVPDLVAGVNTPAYVLDEDDFRGRVFSVYDTLFNVAFVLAVAAAGIWPSKRKAAISGQCRAFWRRKKPRWPISCAPIEARPPRSRDPGCPRAEAGSCPPTRRPSPRSRTASASMSAQAN